MRVSGSYVLLLHLAEDKLIPVGRQGVLDFSAGYYAYVGSAMNGLYQRINRHLRREKKRHWHIDYLLEEAPVVGIIACEDEKRVECKIAGLLAKEFDTIKSFGSSDCNCPGHLFYSAVEMGMKISGMIASLGLEPKIIGTEVEGSVR